MITRCSRPQISFQHALFVALFALISSLANVADAFICSVATPPGTYCRGGYYVQGCPFGMLVLKIVLSDSCFDGIHSLFWVFVSEIDVLLNFLRHLLPHRQRHSAAAVSIGQVLRRQCHQRTCARRA